MALQVNMTLALDSGVSGVDSIQYGPAEFTWAAGDGLQLVKTLAADNFEILEVSDLAGPYYFILLNLETAGGTDVKIGFGQATPIIIPPQVMNIISGPDIPYAAGDGATAKLQLAQHH